MADTESQTPTPIRPGWQTSEWWSSMFAKLISLASLFGVFSQGDVANITQVWATCISAIFLAVISSSVAVSYTWSRTHLKSKALDQGATNVLAKKQ